MSKDDSELIYEAYTKSCEQINEGILARARAGLNNSVLGRAVNAAGNLVTGNWSKIGRDIGSDSAHHKFDSLWKSHQKAFQKTISDFVNDLVKSEVLNQAQGAQLTQEIFNTITTSANNIMGANKGTAITQTGNVIANAGKAVGNAVGNAAKSAGQAIGNAGKAVGNALANPSQTLGKAYGAGKAGIKNFGTAAKQQEKKTLMKPAPVA